MIEFDKVAAGMVIVGALAAMVIHWHNLKRTVRKQQQEIKTISEQLIDYQLNIIRHDEAGRKSLAGDLHDQVLNDLKVMKEIVGNVSDAELKEKLDQISRDIREVMDNLSPTVLETLGLLTSIEDCLRRGAEEANFKLRVKFLLEKNSFDKYSLIEQTLIYRIVQEVKNNICRHSKASKVRLSAREENGLIKIVIEDDGTGIDSGMKNGEGVQTGSSRGMLYMKQRASIIGASVHWRPAVNDLCGGDRKGCVVEIFLPERK